MWVLSLDSREKVGRYPHVIHLPYKKNTYKLHQGRHVASRFGLSRYGKFISSRVELNASSILEPLPYHTVLCNVLYEEEAFVAPSIYLFFHFRTEPPLPHAFLWRSQCG